jgi:lambda family phage portal protein
MSWITNIFSTGKRKKEQLELKNENLRLESELRKIKSIDRAMNRMAGNMGVTQKSALALEIENLFPESEKYSGSLRRYPPLWSASNDKLRRLSRVAYFDSPFAAAIIDRLVDVVIGSGLRLQAEPIWDLIPDAMLQDPEARRKFVKDIESRFHMWAKGYGPSYDLKRNLYQIIRDTFFYLLRDGEYFVIFRYAATGKKNPLSLQIIPPENITGGTTNIQGNTIENGIEYDPWGIEVAYHVLDDATGTTKRIARFGAKSGRILAVHNFLQIDEKQKRGVPYLANIIHELTKLGDYEVLEIQAAVVNSLFAVWTETQDGADDTPLFTGARRRDNAQTPAEATQPTPTTASIMPTHDLDFAKGGIILDGIPAGKSLKSFDPRRPNQGFDNFFTAVKRNLAASKGIPLAVVDLQFNNSYSGARGELLLFWITVDRFRRNHGWDLCDDIYHMWLWGEVDAGRIRAVDFYNDIYREAYGNCEWNGVQRPDIDPLKSVNAHILEQKQGYKTGHQITAERGGGDYDENLKTIKQELAMVAEANEPLAGQQKTGNTNTTYEEENKNE